jgi:hypothetical protein
LGQEYFINSRQLEEKIRLSLPSQGGAGAGFDLTASTQIIPIIDLTESAEGSSLRQDLQVAIDFASTPFSVSATTTTIITSTGFFRVFGTATMRSGDNALREGSFILNDGSTDKKVWQFNVKGAGTEAIMVVPFDFIVFLRAGDSLKCLSPNNEMLFGGSTRQVASISGDLTNPLGFS